MLQDEIARWHQRNFPTAPLEQHALVVGEETGELFRTIIKRAQHIRGTYEEWSVKLQEEAADVVISLYALAYKEGFDLDEAVGVRWSVIKMRDWLTNPTGHGLGDAE